MDADQHLPVEIVARAVRSGRELGWRRSDLPDVLAAARDRGLAALGGQVQFVLPNGTCELYWRNYDSEDRRQGESWDRYVARSHAEVLTAFGRLPSPEELVQEGVASFAFLRERHDEGDDLGRDLWFLCEFLAPADA